MIHVCFQNGAEAPEIVLSEEYESEADAKEQLERLAHDYGTVEGAVAWVEGSKKPKHLEPVEAEIPPTSRLLERTPAAPPSPEAQAAEDAARVKVEAEELAAHEQAVAENEAAHAAAAEAKAAEEKKAAKAEAAKDKK